jgi:hypothetical protein
LSVSPRRRAVEQATRRQLITDRIVAGTLVVVALSGLMSVLPAYTQVAVSRAACRIGSLGLGSCGAAVIDLENSALAPARCPILAALDEALPEVRVAQVSTDRGLVVTISQARTGDVYAALGDGPQPAPPDLLAGDARPDTTVLPGVDVPAQAEWLLPRGQGLDQLVTAVHGRHRQWLEQRSALTLVGSRLFGPELEVPPPALLFGQVRLDRPRLPRFADQARPPQRIRLPIRPRGPVATVNSVRIAPDVAGRTVVDRIGRTTATVAALRGTLRERPVTGALRWTRNADGAISSVLVAVVSPDRMAPREPLGSLPGPAVAYISVPVTTAAEQRLVEAWLSDPTGVSVPLAELLELRPARVGDRLGSFLTRAATVTILRYAFVTPAELQARVTTELATQRRQDWTGVRLVAVSSIAPQPGGGPRTLVEDVGCRS